MNSSGQDAADIGATAGAAKAVSALSLVSDADITRFTEMLASGLLAPVFEHQTAVQGNKALSFDNAVRMAPPKL